MHERYMQPCDACNIAFHVLGDDLNCWDDLTICTRCQEKIFYEGATDQYFNSDLDRIEHCPFCQSDIRYMNFCPICTVAIVGLFVKQTFVNI